ncbi:MAG: aspartate 1-decarboxylase, partial [Dehalococcoidales bacterium]|nr:aspartate 1-decarboxylase [Dehalococcoidales bacterium]
MIRNFLKSKIHRARITGVNLDYEGSITIDSALMRGADIAEYEQVEVLNI